MGRLYFVPHPEATRHIDGLVGGWHDSELTATGREDIDGVGASLRNRIPSGEHTELYSSDLKCASQTAEAISGHLGIPPAFDAPLREKSY